MTGSDYRRIRESLHLQQSDIAAHLEMPVSVIAEREASNEPLAKEIEYAIHYLSNRLTQARYGIVEPTGGWAP